MILLAIDFTSVSSYLAIGPAIALAEELGTPLELLPFRVPQARTPERVPNEDAAQRHARVRAEYRQMDAERYARIQGIKLAVSPTEVDPSSAHGFLLVANDAGVGTEFASVVFERFWNGTLALESSTTVRAILEELGAETKVSPEQLQDRLERVRSRLIDQEVYSVPTFLVNGERFIGRQHLPMIRWMLTGEKKPSPI